MRSLYIKIIGLSIMLLGFSVCLPSQGLNFKQTNYTIADGLPSNECHDVIQDSLGYIWIATDRGLVKFDGYTFKTYGISDGLRDLCCLRLRFDKNGNIWIRTLSHQLFIYRPDIDAIELYQYQHLIDPYLKQFPIMDFHIDSLGNLTVALSGLGFLTIGISGIEKLERGIKSEEYVTIFTKVFPKEILLSSDMYSRSEPFIYKHNIKKVKLSNGYLFSEFKIVHNDTVYNGIINTSNSNSITFAHQVSASQSILLIGGVTYFFDSHKGMTYTSDNAYVDVKPWTNGRFVSAELSKKGVKVIPNFESFEEEKYKHLLKDVSATRLLVQTENELWVTTLANGIYRLSHQSVDKLGISLPSPSKITQVELGPQGLYFVVDKQTLYSFANSNVETILTSPTKGIRHLEYQEGLNELLVSMPYTVSLDSSHKSSEISCQIQGENFDKATRGLISSIKSFCFSRDDIIFANPENILQYNDLSKEQIFDSRHSKVNLRVFSVLKLKASSYLLGTINGLKCLRDNKIEKVDNHPEQLKLRINAIEKTNDIYAFGTQGNGLVFWDLADKVQQVSTTEGLISNNVEELFIDSNDNIYVCTKSGLSKVWFDDSDSIHVKNYTTFHGLPSNEVNDIAQLGDSLYIATGGGLAILEGEPTLADKQTIRIENMWVNGEQIQFEQKNEFSHKENSLLINYKTLDYSMEGQIPYRYKLNKGDWTETQSTFANFSALSPGEYTYSVQSKNIDDIWSDAATYDFRIKLPWWRTWWFYVFGLCVIGLLGFTGYKRRTSFLKNKIRVEREIRDLERSALQAQMNPHFIFNCLNSIQRFIMHNDKENAMEYLAKFARLIRQTLNASVDNQISLDKEISMLHNYLDLEKLRFKDKFDYRILINDNVIPEEISIPPLLIQPFVENAIIHGMQDILTGGQIDLLFSKVSSDQIQVLIRDNGRRSEKKNDSQGHKSLGMSITGKRLAYNNEISDAGFQIEPHYSDAGTEVVITIRV